MDKCVLVWMEQSERIGMQGWHDIYNKDTKKFDTEETFIDQQRWKISVLYKRTTAEVTEDNMPYTTQDIAGMLIAWFNRLGCQEFRKHNCANLIIKGKDLKTYKATSDVQQWVSEFPLYLQVIKTFSTETEPAKPKFEGMIPV